MRQRLWIAVGVVGMLALTAGRVAAAIVPVAPGESIQTAIDQASPGDVIALDAGTYVEDIDYGGKAVTVLGLGPDTVLQGTGTGPVVSFISGEGPGSVLDSVVVTGGHADRGAAVYIVDADPTIVRNILFANQARFEGSAIYMIDSAPRIANNLLLYNHTVLRDPHAIQVTSSAPTIVNNTIARNDSNGILTLRDAPADIRNNMIIRNGSRGRGRGICDFSDAGVARIHYNLFWRNRKSALLTNGKDFRGIGRANRSIGLPRLAGNVGGNPRLLLRRIPPIGSRKFEAITVQDLADGLRPRMDVRRQRAVDAGDPDPVYNDLDGSRNDIGFTGGPDAPTW